MTEDTAPEGAEPTEPAEVEDLADEQLRTPEDADEPIRTPEDGLLPDQGQRDAESLEVVFHPGVPEHQVWVGVAHQGREVTAQVR